MTKTFTRNDIIRYFYDEMTTKEQTEFNRVLNENPGFRNEYSELVYTLEQINNIETEPSTAVVNKILEYSKKYDQTSEKV